MVNGDRQADYGDPRENWEQTAELFSGTLRPYLRPGVRIPARVAALLMIEVKVARETHRHKRDNAVDIAGYAGIIGDHLSDESPPRTTRVRRLLDRCVGWLGGMP